MQNVIPAESARCPSQMLLACAEPASWFAGRHGSEDTEMDELDIDEFEDLDEVDDLDEVEDLDEDDDIRDSAWGAKIRARLAQLKS